MGRELGGWVAALLAGRSRLERMESNSKGDPYFLRKEENSGGGKKKRGGSVVGRRQLETTVRGPGVKVAGKGYQP